MRSAPLSAVVTPFRACRTDLPGYHTFPSLHPSATFTAHSSVWLLGFDLDRSLTPVYSLVCDFCSSDRRFARGLVCSPHPASFRFHLTMDTLAFGYILPTTGRIRDLHPLKTCAARRTIFKSPLPVLRVAATSGNAIHYLPIIILFSNCLPVICPLSFFFNKLTVQSLFHNSHSFMNFW